MNLFLELINGKIFTKYCSHFKLYSHLRRKSKHDKFDRVQISRKEQQPECKCIIQSQNSYFLNKLNTMSQVPYKKQQLIDRAFFS